MAETAMANVDQLWDQILQAAFRFPGVRVNRADFLRAALGPHVPAEVVEQAIASTPARAGIYPQTVDRAARASLNWHRAGVTALSTVAGIPGGLSMLGTIPADLAQYFWHLIVVVQKMAYLYGWPSFIDEEGELDDETRTYITVFIGAAMGAEAANVAIRETAVALAKEVVVRLPRMALTKFALYALAKEIAKWIGVRLTKEVFAKAVAGFVPVLGGIVAGTVTWVTFSIAANRLRKHLASLPLAGGPG